MSDRVTLGPLEVRWLGRIAYAEAEKLQQRQIAARRDGRRPDTLLLLEHDPVITLGRGADPAHVLTTREELARRGIALHEAGRGGDVTYHGPGQLVGYPIIAIPPARRDAHRYLRELEEVLIRTVAAFGVAAERKQGLTGIWVGDAKLAAIGVRLSTGWITSHGFALNVSADPEGFGHIVPCGLAAYDVTALATLAGTALDVTRVAGRAAREFASVFAFDPVQPDDPRERLAIPATPGVSFPS